jgi:phosphoribosylformylglycinamidine synthase
MVKIRLEISYLSGVEDPEATTLHHNLGILGYYGIDEVKILRVYELEFSEDIETAQSMAKTIAESILINPVINSYKLIVIGE